MKTENIKQIKKFICLIFIVSLVIMTSYSLSFAQAKGLGVAGSTHDFSVSLDDWNPTYEICRVCHVPHDHGRTQKYWEAYNGLLWNHAVVSADYTMYSSNTLDGAIDGDPSGVAKLCLGCHDGSVAIDTFDRYSGGSYTMWDINPNLVIPRTGTPYDLSATHPISIVYDVSADTNGSGNSGLNPTTTVMGDSGTIADVLDGGKVQCSSCHDVHDKLTVAGTYLLRLETSRKNRGGTGIASALCLVCHNK